MKAKSNATRRTKNRVSEHERLVIISTKVAMFEGHKEHALFKCMDEDCTWWGWLPVDELELSNGNAL